MHIAPSEGVLRGYFHHLNQKLISNAVDITNFVLLATGAPTHAYDLDKIEGGIVVRNAHPGEQIKLLDGSTRTLVAEDLVVADEQKALGLAGVMGGYDSMITAETKNILVEAAWFSHPRPSAPARAATCCTLTPATASSAAQTSPSPPRPTRWLQGTSSPHAAAASKARSPTSSSPRSRAETATRPPIQLSVTNVQRLLGTTLAPEGITAALVEPLPHRPRLHPKTV